MQTTRISKPLSLILSIVLIAAMALFTTGCNDSKNSESSGSSSSVVSESTAESADASSDITVIGEGAVKFSFNVTDSTGTEKKFEVHTDKKTVGEALLDVNLISGDESEYGLYVKTVDGITADFDKDGVYWAFYVDGKYAETGVDSTEVKEGSVYSFKIEK